MEPSKEFVLSLDKQLVRGQVSAKEIITQYGKEESKEKNVKLFKNLAEILSDPWLDFPELLKTADKEWQILALSEGLKENQNVLISNNASSIYQIFEQIIIQQANPFLKAAIEQGKELVMKTISTHNRPSIPKEIAAEAYIDQTKFDLLQNDLCNPKGLISWEVFNFLINSKFALRHVSSCAIAQEQLVQGVFGDALSISSGISSLVFHLIRDAHLPGRALKDFIDDENEGNLHDKYLKLFHKINSVVNEFTAQERHVILLQFEKALRQFILKSTFWMDNPIPYNSSGWKAEWEKRLSESSTFIICDLDRWNFPYDQNNYFNLGKCGKSQIQPQEMLFCIFPPSLEEIMKFKNGISDVTEQVLAVREATVDYILEQLLDKIKIKSKQ